MPYTPPPELAELTLAQIADHVAQRALPPIESWAPDRLGDSKMRIAANGTWHHDGTAITRPAMVRAFAGLLIRDEQGAYWLMTPFEKLSIAVEDAPFMAVDVASRDGDLAFRINTDDLIIAGPNNPLRAAGDAERPALYLQVRNGCEARINRSTYEQLAQIALDRGDGWTVRSCGQSFSLLPQ